MTWQVKYKFESAIMGTIMDGGFTVRAYDRDEAMTEAVRRLTRIVETKYYDVTVRPIGES